METYNKNLIKKLINEYPEIFKEVCLILKYTYSNEIENYNEGELKELVKTFKNEYRNIFKEL